MKITDTRKLGRSKLMVGVLGLGGATLAGTYRASPDAEAEATIEAAWQAGVRFYDTAPFYGYGLSEHRFGHVLRRHPREQFVLSTKVGRLLEPLRGARDPGDMWFEPLPFKQRYDYTRAGILRSLDDSLQRLGMDRVDVLLVHDIGRFTHGDQNAHYMQQLIEGGGLAALDDLRRAGTVGAVGIGANEWEVVWEVMKDFDLDCCLLAGRYTLLEQRTLTPFLAGCEARGVGIILGGPFNSGILASGSSRAPKFQYADAPPDVIARVKQLEAACADFNVPLAAAALQFPLAHPAVATVVPGGRTPAEMQQNIAWFEQPIPPAFWQALRDRSLIDPHAPLPFA